MSKSTSRPDNLSSAFRSAFFWHWHLLGLGSAISFALISGAPADWAPVIIAADIVYLTLVVLSPGLLRAMQSGRNRQQDQPRQDSGCNSRFQQLMSFLRPADDTRFRELHQRCAALLELRRRMDTKVSQPSVDNFRSESLDRMLWLFLKLLHQRSGLERFLHTTARSEIEQDLKVAEEQLAAARARDTVAGLPDGRLTTAIAERLRTLQERLENHEKASADLELVTAEIDKTEQQITHLCEIGMTTRDSASLSAQIDAISESLQVSEKTFAHAAFANLFESDETAPPLLSAGSAPWSRRPIVTQH